MNEILKTLEDNFDKHLNDLETLIKIPSISFPGFDLSTVDQSAKAVAKLMKDTGLENVQILKFGKALPYVYADWLHAEGAPTVLLYAHHDVQPVGREDVWQTSPFEPTRKEGPGGLRLYARGSADDKAGIIVHTSALHSYLKTVGKLPVNVKVLIEGEEEIGSPNLLEFLTAHKDLIKADYMALTDTANFDCGIPSLTTGLRGMVVLEVEVHALNKTIHSGLWSGPLPDPAMALSKVLGDLVDENGDIAIDEIKALIPEMTEAEKQTYADLPFDEARFREQSGLLDGATVHTNTHPWAKVWSLPALTVNAVQASSRAQAGNIINDYAWTRISLRIAPGMDAQKTSDALQNFIRKNTPWGLHVKIKEDTVATPWKIDPFAKDNKPAFDAALRALENGYGTKATLIGCGATIPFVKPFAEALDDAPALLIGVEDPYTNAHGENESLLLSDFEGACKSQVYLLEELGKL